MKGNIKIILFVTVLVFVVVLSLFLYENTQSNSLITYGLGDTKEINFTEYSEVFLEDEGNEVPNLVSEMGWKFFEANIYQYSKSDKNTRSYFATYGNEIEGNDFTETYTMEIHNNIEEYNNENKFEGTLDLSGYKFNYLTEFEVYKICFEKTDKYYCISTASKKSNIDYLNDEVMVKIYNLF